MDKTGTKKDWDWNLYYDKKVDEPMRDTLKQAFIYWGDRPPGFAVDLGCGSGNETIHLLKAGWQVLATDITEEGLNRLKARADIPDLSKLETQIAAFENYTLPKADLINSSYSLPFCEPDKFPALWDRIKKALKPGGVFCGHFFGQNDSWVKHGLTNHSHEELDAMLEGLNIFYFEENEEDAETVDDRIKHWHIFDVVAYRAA
jgi:tellurite methyltransferase